MEWTLTRNGFGRATYTAEGPGGRRYSVSNVYGSGIWGAHIVQGGARFERIGRYADTGEPLGLTSARAARVLCEADERIARRHEQGGDMEQMRAKVRGGDPLAAAMMAIWDEPIQEVR